MKLLGLAQDQNLEDDWENIERIPVIDLETKPISIKKFEDEWDNLSTPVSDWYPQI